MEQTNELSENERAIASELNETNEICEMSEQLVSMLRDEAEIIWSEADGSISYTTHLHVELGTSGTKPLNNIDET